jgi:hypothetical protein
VHPIAFAAAAGRLLGGDRSAALRAGFPGHVGRVIFAGVLAGFGEVGIGELLALHVRIALLGCISGDHWNHFPASWLIVMVPPG